MGRSPASTARELELVDALDRLSAREVARLVYGDPGLYARVSRRRQKRRRPVVEMSDQELDAVFARLRELAD